jgi:hypothetical protein
MLREVAWVVFDEVHYMQDRERGVVWEESIIFLPKDIHMVHSSCSWALASMPSLPKASYVVPAQCAVLSRHELHHSRRRSGDTV